MKKFIILPLLSLVLLVAGCSGTKTVTNNHYDDGIYHDPSQDDGSFTLGDIKEPTTTTNPNANAGDYADPSYGENGNQYYDNTGDVVVNNYYGTPSLRSPRYQTGLYWNSWGGFGMYAGYGWGSCYDPFFYDPWYSPYCYSGFYNPYRYGYGWAGGWGYNSYWAGYYNGYYHGSTDAYYSGNKIYTGYIPASARSGSYNSRNRSIIGRRSTIANNSRRNTIDRGISGRNTIDRGRSAVPTRTNTSNRNNTVTRLNDEVLSRNRNVSAVSTDGRRTVGSSSRNYSNNTYDYVKQRSNYTGNNRPAAINNRNDVRNNTRATAPGRTSGNPAIRSRSKDDYFNRTNQNTREQTPARANTPSRTTRPARTNTPQRTTPSRTTTPRSNTPQRTTPSRNNTPQYTPRSNDVPQRSTPSRSTTPNRSRSYTPQRSSTPSRATTPSRSSGSYSTPSRSSGNSRGSSGASRRR